MRPRLLEQNVLAFTAGALFAIGLALSGMTLPQKIISFLDPWNWDPSLLFVMVGAIGVHGVSYQFIRKRKSPILDSQWHLPSRSDITWRLIIGSSLFGIGWGLGGYCPGPGLTSLTSSNLQPLLFVTSMLIGMTVFQKTERYLNLPE